MRGCLKELPRVQAGRNPSWRESALLGLVTGVVWAPMTLWMALKGPLALIATGLWQLVVALVVFVAMRVWIVGYGIAGHLRHSGWGYGQGE